MGPLAGLLTSMTRLVSSISEALRAELEGEMGQIGQVIAAAGSLALNYAERLMAGVSQQNYARLARPGGVELRSNHAAFILGHLAIYPARILPALQASGAAPATAAPPASYEVLFKNGAECVDDPHGSIYPGFDELQRHFFDGYRATLQATIDASDQTLLSPNPGEGRMKELFPTIGAVTSFYIAGHTQMHLGQLSAWRRACGLPAA